VVKPEGEAAYLRVAMGAPALSRNGAIDVVRELLV
jgi:hypothetical protein